MRVHRRVERSFFRSAKQESTLQMSLRVAEDLLTQRIDQTLAKKPGHQDIFFFEMDIPAEELRWLQSRLGQFLLSTHSWETALKEYRRVLIASLCYAAMCSEREGAVWPQFWYAIDQEQDHQAEVLVRESLKGILRRIKLKSFDNKTLGQNFYVSHFLIHAGLTVSHMYSIVDFIRSKNWSSIADNTEYQARAIITAIHNRELDSESLREFVSHAENTALDFCERIVELVPHFDHSPFTDETFEGTHGLPEVAFHALVRATEYPQQNHALQRSHSGDLSDLRGEEQSSKEQTRPKKIQKKKPYLYLDTEHGSTMLILPSWSEQKGQWHISDEEENRTITGRKQGQYQSSMVVENPFIDLHARWETGASAHEWNIRSAWDDIPIFFFNMRGHQIRSQYEPGKKNTFLKKKKYYVLASEKVNFLSTQDYSSVVERGTVFCHGDWHKYEVKILDLRDQRELLMVYEDLGKRHEYRIPVSGHDRLEWDMDVRTLAHCRDRSLSPIYIESPWAIICDSEDAQWFFEIYREGELIDEYDIEVRESVPCPVQIFQDYEEEAWLGSFEVRALRQGRLEDELIISMAEGMSLSSSLSTLGGEEKECRYPEAESIARRLRGADHSGLVLSSYDYSFDQLAEKNTKKISFPSEAQSMDPTQTSAPFSMSTPQGYVLEGEVIPPYMEYSISTRDRGIKKSSIPESICVDDLSAHGFFSISSPVPLAYARVEILLDGMAYKHLKTEENLPTRTIRISHDLLRFALQNKKRGQIVLSFDFAQQSSHGTQGKNNAYVLEIYSTPLVTEIHQEGDIIQVIGGSSLHMGEGATLCARAWQLEDLSREPQILSCSSTGENGWFFHIPQNLLYQGALVVDFHEEYEDDFFVFSSPSEVPTRQALLLPNSPSAPISEVNDHQSEERIEEFRRYDWNTEELIDLWEEVELLSRLRFSGPEGRILTERQKCLCAAMTRNPRRSLVALGLTNLSASEQIAALISSALVSYSYAVRDTGNEYHNNKRIALLEEMVDIKFLTHSLAGHPDFYSHHGEEGLLYHEKEESEKFIEEAGGSILLNLLRGEEPDEKETILTTFARSIEDPFEFFDFTDMEELRRVIDENRSLPLCHINVRLVAFMELFSYHPDINSIDGFIRLKEAAEVILRSFPTVTDGQEYELFNRNIADLREYAERLEKDTPHSRYTSVVWVPYISYIYTNFARMRAYSAGAFATDPSRAEKAVKSYNRSKKQWEELARIIPQLTSFDLIMADAFWLAHGELQESRIGEER